VADREEHSVEEVRQADRHRLNFRVLIVSLVVLIIAFAVVYFYNRSVTPETETTLQAGESIEDTNLVQSPAEAEAEAQGTPSAADPEAGELEIAPQ